MTTGMTEGKQSGGKTARKDIGLTKEIAGCRTNDRCTESSEVSRYIGGQDC